MWEGLRQMNIAIIYATKTNHSKKLAEAIGFCLNIQAQNITEKPTLQDVDLLFIVGGIYGGLCMPELLEYLRVIKSPLPKYAALVTSCGSGKQRQIVLRNTLEEKGIVVLDEFVCRGRIFFVSITHPDAKDLKEVAEFAKKIVGKIEN